MMFQGTLDKPVALRTCITAHCQTQALHGVLSPKADSVLAGLAQPGECESESVWGSLDNSLRWIRDAIVLTSTVLMTFKKWIWIRTCHCE